MKLFLTSMGITQEIKQDFLKFLKDAFNKNPNQLSMAFIPTAGYEPEEIIRSDRNPKELKGEDTGLIDETLEILYGMGFKIYEVDINDYVSDDVKSSKERLKKALEGKDIIYVNAGNTFYLMDRINKSGFAGIVRELLDSNVVYVGSSAGSIVACPDISVAGWHPNWDKNLIGLKDFKGMGLVDFIVSPHFIDSDREVLVQRAKESEYPVIAISNRQSIVVNAKKVKIVGDRERVIYGVEGLDLV